MLNSLKVLYANVMNGQAFLSNSQYIQLKSNLKKYQKYVQNESFNKPAA